MSGISVSQVGTIHSCHCWADVRTWTHLHAKVSNPLLVGASKVDYLVFKQRCKVEKLPSSLRDQEYDSQIKNSDFVFGFSFFLSWFPQN